MKKEISIIIITYNSSKYILTLLDSIKNDSANIREVIVIENNSPDAGRTREFVSSYARKVAKTLKIRFISSKKNNGFGKSCNLGASKASGEYILFINPDTNVQPGSLSKLLLHAEKLNADIIGGKSITFSGKQHLTAVRKPNLNIGLFEFSNLGKLFKTERGYQDFYYLDKPSIKRTRNDRIVDALGGAYLMVRNSVFTKLKGFDEGFFMYLEDVDLSVRAKKLGMKVVYCPHSIIYHVGGASSNNKYKIRHQAWFDSRKYFYKKHFGFLTNLLIQPLYEVEEFLLKKIKKV